MSERSVLVVLGDERREPRAVACREPLATATAACRSLRERDVLVTVATLTGRPLGARARIGDLPSSLMRPARLAWVNAARYGALLICEGLGACDDLASDGRVARLVRSFAAADRPIATIGRALAVLLATRDAFGRALLAGRRVTFSPPDLEAAVRRVGAHPLREPAGAEHVSVDGYFVTAQDARSVQTAARQLAAYLPASARHRATRAG